jgi:hypothetical protein
LSIYLSTNSPAKLIEEAKEDAIDLSEKLEKIVTAVELKALAVPAAILLATKEIEKGEGVTPLNGLVASSTLLFAITMVYVFRSQKAMLKPLRFTIHEIRSDYIDRGLDEKNGRLDVNFSGLISRLDWAMSAARAVRLLSFSPLLAVFLAMYLKPKASSTSAQTGSAPAGVNQEASGSEKSGSIGSHAPGSSSADLKGGETEEITLPPKE